MVGYLPVDGGPDIQFSQGWWRIWDLGLSRSNRGTRSAVARRDHLVARYRCMVRSIAYQDRVVGSSRELPDGRFCSKSALP
jgi:hypothetical protein